MDGNIAYLIYCMHREINQMQTLDVSIELSTWRVIVPALVCVSVCVYKHLSLSP